MQWVLSHATDGLHHWQLQEQAQTRSLIFNPHRLSLRLSGKSKRLFFLQVQGFLHKKIQLCSEYGVVIAETAFTDKPLTGQLTCNEQKFFYAISHNAVQLLNSEKELLGSSIISLTGEEDKHEIYSLLFGLTWFLTADPVVEKAAVLTGTA